MVKIPQMTKNDKSVALLFSLSMLRTAHQAFGIVKKYSYLLQGAKMLKFLFFPLTFHPFFAT